MSGLTATMDNKLVDHINGGTAFTQPTTPLKARLMTANGSASAAGTEVTGGSYASQSVTMTAASSGASANNANVVFTLMPAVTVVGVEIWDSAVTPVRLWWGPLSVNKVMNLNDTFQFDTGNLSVSIA
jgi:hypothetical protein